ncbi:MAG: hypothetical protein ACNA77_09605 [Opitutales bacterium]
MSRTRIFWILLVALLGLACPERLLQAQDGTELSGMVAELWGPLQLELKNGNRQVGRVVSHEGDTLRLAVQIGTGSAEMTFQKSDIRTLRFPGEKHLSTLADWMRDGDRVEDAMALFRAFYQQRRPYFDYLQPGEFNLFVEYARFALGHGEPLRAVAIMKVLREHIEDPVILQQMDEDTMLAFFHAAMLEEAETKARAWIRQAEPAGDSALGWRILAELHLREERYEQAFWTALHPVAFSNQLPMAHLEACYAFAIVAAEALRYQKEPARLAREMRSRGLAWPDAIEMLTGRAPPAYLEDPKEKANPEAEEPGLAGEEEEAVKTPSPVDPEIELPTRILF